MGHYRGVRFTAQVTDLGAEILKVLYETRSWEKTVALFPEYQFVELAGDEKPPVPFSEPWDWDDAKQGKPGSSFDEATGTWSVACYFKDHGGRFEKPFWKFLAHIIQSPVQVEECGDYITGIYRHTVEPLPPPCAGLVPESW